jgi:MinD-like ATPase involved in chromosome partitioning or flagellar assembly
VSDRDDAVRRELGWTGPAESEYEPTSGTGTEPAPEPAAPVPSRPPIEFATPPHLPTPHGADTGPIPAQRPRPPQAPAGWPPPGPPPARPHAPGPPPGRQPYPGPQWQAPGHPQGRPAQPPPGSYADRIPVHDLVPVQRTPPGRGWRRLLFQATFGMVNLGPSPDEVRQAELESRIRGVLRGHYKIGVLGKGGVGKTTVSASVGSVFAELRQDDRVVAIDADTAFGKLGSRVDPKAGGSYWELASDQHLETFADIRSRVGNNAAGLFVLAGEGTPARRRVLDPAIYREATARLDRYFSISIVDCSSTMDSPVTQEVLRDLDALIVVSSPWVDGAAAAGQTMDWLANRGLTGLLQRTVVVLNDSDGHADKRTRGILAQQFAGQGQAVVEVPFDGQLRPGGVIAGTRVMSTKTRRKFLEVAAALAAHFPVSDDRNRERF